MTKSVDLFVIGGGSGGVRAARIASQHGAKVAIAEESRYGGTCVIRGCVPKKFFVYSSTFGHLMEDAKGYGWSIDGSFDWPTLVTNKDARIDRLNGIYISLLNNAGVEVLDGRAIVTSPNSVEIGGETYEAKYILLATGGRPMRPDIPGSELAITSDEIFHLETLPKDIVVVGAGYIGCEFSSILCGLGASVRLIHHRSEALRGFDDDLRHAVTENLEKYGIDLLFEAEIASIEKTESGKLHYRCNNGSDFETDLIMFSTGRRPHTRNLGLEDVGVQTNVRGGVCIDEWGQSSVDSIYAVGDCTDRIQLTPVAIREGHAVADNLFAPDIEKRSLVHNDIPTAIFTQPEAATVGLSEAAASELHDVEVYLAKFTPLFHSMSGRDEKVMMKMIVDKASERVVGAHMVGEHAADIIQMAAIAINMGATKADFDKTVALHPSTAEEWVLMRTPRASK